MESVTLAFATGRPAASTVGLGASSPKAKLTQVTAPIESVSFVSTPISAVQPSRRTAAEAVVT
jgi:hypothetical protein